MNDDLHQLLHRADNSAPIPAIDAIALPNRIRRTARNQRRAAACSLAILALLLISPVLFIRHTTPSPVSLTPVNASFSTEVEARIHIRTAELLLASDRHPRKSTVPADAFLVELQMQRNRAALVLLRDATHSLDPNDPRVATTLKRTIDLFPDTPAAAAAAKQLQQLESPKRQS